MQLKKMTKAELIHQLNQAERNSVRFKTTRFKREFLLLIRDSSHLVRLVYRLGQRTGQQVKTHISVPAL